MALVYNTKHRSSSLYNSITNRVELAIELFAT